MERLNTCVFFFRSSILISLPPNQPTVQKVKNLNKLDIFQPIWLKLSMESLNKRTQHMHTIHPVKPAYHPNTLLA